MNHRLTNPLVLLLGILVCNAATAAEEFAIESIRVEPQEIVLSGKNRQQQITITGVRSDNSVVDLTHQSTITVLDEEVIRNDAGLLTGLAEGETIIAIKAGEHSQVVSVSVAEFSTYPAINFEVDIIPLLTKLGCNGGGCHGKQSGQNGFKLSVFGFDPKADFDAIVKEGRGRRVFPGAITKSLIYTKAIGISAHGGGQRMTSETQDAELLREWILQGMPWGEDDTARVVAISVEPEIRVMKPRSLQQLRVTATYDDGRTRDVTRASAFVSNEAVIAECNNHGVIETGKVPGEAAITISYLGFVDVSRVVVPKLGAESPQRPNWFNEDHPIDNLVWNKWEYLRLEPSELTDDATFLRRLMIKTSGTIPTGQQVRDFLKDNSPDKRAKAIEAALNSEQFVSYWTQRWSDILMVNSATIGSRGAYTFYRWLRQQVQQNRPYDQWVFDIIVATGNTGQVGPANFFRGQRTPEDATKSISQAFLGIRMDCAQCHHHPFEKWGQDDFYGLAGFFNGMKRESLDENRELIYHPGHKSMAIPVINQPVDTRPLAGSATSADDRTDPRPELASWVTARDNPTFSRLVSNRIWKHLMGRGLVEPEDDFRETNPPTNPELLDHLANTLVENNFDIKSLMRHILNSKSFQLSSTPNESNYTDDQMFSHYLVRRMPAEVMLDAICHITLVPEKYAGHPEGTRAIDLWDNQLPSYFLDTFGRNLRESPCECGSSGDPTMAQALHLLNAPEIELKLQSGNGRVSELTKSDLDVDKLIEEIALVTANRLPNQKEIAIGKQLLNNPSRRQGIEDFLWVMMNSYDFLFVK
ncbi:MAG: DUF1549 and DUF1553 domain-containing protein [Pirellulaceae bacterium]